MEIKIIEDTPANGVDLTKDSPNFPCTFIYTCVELGYNRVIYKNKEEFKRLWNTHTGSKTIIIGLDREGLWDEGKEIEPGSFLVLWYRSDEEKTVDATWRYTVVSNATIYITNNGQTIDVIYC